MGSGTAFTRLIAACAMVLALATSAHAGVCSDARVSLRGPNGGEARFRVELADSAAARAQGLMNRESLARSAGMLFVYPRAQSVGFWMKNTLIPLDMIFMDASGTVARVKHEAQPHDTRPVFGGDDVQTVLEINGGLARDIGIAPGWQMQHPAVDPDAAAWPCGAGE